MELYGSIEAGGTKFVCGIGNAQSGSRETLTVPTADPDSTFASIASFFAEPSSGIKPKAIGIGGFGPIDVNPSSPTYGTILRTPKPGWTGTNMIGRVRELCDVPVALDTDVNAAALAEARLLGDLAPQLAYVTIGTGIGVGLVVDGRPVHGRGHPEMGHIRVVRHAGHDHFAGVCPFHGDCLEGLASGPAIGAAWGAAATDLPDDHAFWDIEAFYIAQLCTTLLLSFSPHRIVLGGGVMNQSRLFTLVREKTASMLAGYLTDYPDAASLEGVIVPPASREAPGLIGGYLLAEEIARS